MAEKNGPQGASCILGLGSASFALPAFLIAPAPPITCSPERINGDYAVEILVVLEIFGENLGAFHASRRLDNG